MTTTPDPILTKEELETPRTAAEMLEWVDAAGQRFDTKELKAEARLGKHFFKQLMEEARPIALFARRHYGTSADAIITHVLGNQHHDALVEDRRASPGAIKYLEVTGTSSYEDALRLEVLNGRGSVPMLGKILRVKRGLRRGEIEVEGEAQEHERIVGDYLPRVLSAVQNKAKNPNYEAGTALIVAVDDYMALRNPEDTKALDAYAKDQLLPALASTPFVVLALEGGRDIHLEYALK